MREIGDAAGLASPASVKYQLDILEEKGFIRRDENRGRAMEVVLPDSMVGASAPTDKTRFIPLVGRIAAGGPITAEQDVEEIVPLPESLVGSGDLFMLKVVGDSMVNAAICDGDFVVIRSQKDCNKGEIVAAMIDGEATVKTFSRKDGQSGCYLQTMTLNPSTEITARSSVKSPRSCVQFARSQLRLNSRRRNHFCSNLNF